MQEQLKPSSSSDKKKLRPKDYLGLKRAIQHEKIGIGCHSNIEDEEMFAEKYARLTLRFDKQKLKQTGSMPLAFELCHLCDEKFEDKNLLIKHRKRAHYNRKLSKKKRGSKLSMRKKKKFPKTLINPIAKTAESGLIIEKIDVVENNNAYTKNKESKKAIVITIAGLSKINAEAHISSQESTESNDSAAKQQSSSVKIEEIKAQEAQDTNQKLEYSTSRIPSHEEIDRFLIENLMKEGKTSEHFNIFTKENFLPTTTMSTNFEYLLSNEKSLVINLCDESKRGFVMLKKKILFIEASALPLYFTSEWFNKTKKNMKEKWIENEKLAMPFSILVVWLHKQINENIFYKTLFLLSFILGYIRKEALAKSMTEESYFIYFILEGQRNTQQMLSKLLELGKSVKQNVIIEINNSNLFLVVLNLLKDFLVAHNILSACGRTKI